MKHFIFIFLFGWMVFGFLTFISFLLSWDWNNRLDFRLGFPVQFSRQFHLHGENHANHGGKIINLLIDIIFAWMMGWLLLRFVKKRY